MMRSTYAVILTLTIIAAACGSSGGSAPTAPTTSTTTTTTPTTPTTATPQTNVMALAVLPNNGDAGSLVAALDLPPTASLMRLLSIGTSAVPVNSATLTLKSGKVIPLIGSLDVNTRKVTLASADGYYKFTIDLNKIEAGGTFTTSDGKIGGLNISIVSAPPTPAFWCGTFNGDEKGWLKINSSFDGQGTGKFNLTFDDGTGVTGSGEKMATNNSASFSFSLGDGGTASGSFSILGGNTMSGQWSNSYKQKGQFSASTFGCS